MITDVRTLFSEDQAVTADAASTNYMDLKSLGITYDGVQLLRKAGIAKIPLFVAVTEAFDNLTSLTISVQTDDNTSFSSAKNVVSYTVALADLVAGFQLPIDVLPVHTERYIRLYYDVTGTNPAAGKIEAGIVTAVDRAYRG